jgi:hypothetical protein
MSNKPWIGKDKLRSRRLVFEDTEENNYKPESVQSDSKQAIEIVTSRRASMLTAAQERPHRTFLVKLTILLLQMLHELLRLGKDKFVPVLNQFSITLWRRMGRGEGGRITPQFLTSTLDSSDWSASSIGRFNPEERAPGTNSTGGSVGPRAGLTAVEKRKIFCPCREWNPGLPGCSYRLRMRYDHTLICCRHTVQANGSFITCTLIKV